MTGTGKMTPDPLWHPIIPTDSAWIDPNARMFGDVRLAAGASLWPFAVIRAARNHVAIGICSSLQDHAMAHIGWDEPTIVGDYCTIGHRAVVHGCTIDRGCLIGIGATVMERCVVGEGSIVAAHSYLPPDTVVPPHSLVMGTPGRIVRTIDRLRAHIVDALLYAINARAYAIGNHRAWADVDLAELGAEADRILAASPAAAQVPDPGET